MPEQRQTAHEIISEICNRRRNSDIRVYDREIIARFDEEMALDRQRLANAQALIRKIQDTVSAAFGPGERWSDFDVLDQGVAMLAKNKSTTEQLKLRWNRAASKYACGSEFIDDPERVFAHIDRCIEFRILLTTKRERGLSDRLADALKEIKDECYTNIECNHQEQDSKISPDECENIDDCIGCTLTQIVDAALAQYTASRATPTSPPTAS